ncbi:heterokaryon incompatibility protein-domain-containing protein [Paraphoma chrysanthemicola]|uniref:Heterokaryon incompatibility protein-domain-containing protein n=1 Tax=Paraphoma chrysanthemicola TaxID=798071 RepID=A0A8K0VTN4_9PLEO|nr:heterokaryon incompatibility protein-domain-containing protein [Paraphoma chrysanthemicola]
MASSDRVGRLVCRAYPNLGIPALYVHNLTGIKDADSLLCKPPLIHPATPDVLPKLRQWNPEVAAAFLEKGDAVKDIPFKLITRSPTWASSEIDSFVAISYCWQNEHWSVPARFSSTPVDWSFPLCPSMLRALLSCVDAREAIWIDQLCIDQQDQSQKALAISSMDTIYRNALRVLILLEDFDIDVEVERSLNLLADSPAEPENITTEKIYITPTAFSENYSTCFTHGSTASLVQFSVDLFDTCRWFSRAWCCQEYQLNKERIFLFVGHKSPCLALDSTFFTNFHAQYSQTDTASGLDGLDLHPGFQMFSFGIGVNHPDEFNQFILPSLFVELERLQCLHLRDIISIVLNTTGIFLSFDKDVASRAQCQFILGLILLSVGCPMVLDSIGPPLYKWPMPSYQGIIRWPVDDDFRYHADDWGVARLTSSSNFGYIRHDSIALDLFIFKPHPKSPASASIQVATLLWKASILSMRNVGIETLAAAVEIGLSWMARTTRDVLEWTSKGQLAKRAELVKVWKILAGDEIWQPERRIELVKSVEMLAGTETKAPDETPAVGNIEDVQDVVLSLLEHLRYVKRTAPMIVSLNKESTRHAIVFIPLRFSEAILCSSAHLSFAIPAVLNNPTTACLRRLWILSTSKISKSMLSIVGQGFYIGEQLDSDDEVTLVHNITVVGRWSDELNVYESEDEWSEDLGTAANLGLEWDSDGGRW